MNTAMPLATPSHRPARVVPPTGRCIGPPIGGGPKVTLAGQEGIELVHPHPGHVYWGEMHVGTRRDPSVGGVGGASAAAIERETEILLCMELFTL